MTSWIKIAHRDESSQPPETKAVGLEHKLPAGSLPSKPDDRLCGSGPTSVALLGGLQPSLRGPRSRRMMSGPRSGRKGRNRSAPSRLPPVLQTSPVVNHTFRYVNSSASPTTISVGNLLLTCGGVCTVANTTFAGVATSVRLRRIQVWAAPNTSSSASANVIWLPGAFAGIIKDVEKNTTIPMGLTTTTTLDERPPRNSLAADWLSSSLASSQVFTIACAAGSVIDVSLTFTILNNLPNASSGISSGVQGNVYYLYLDGASTHRYQPFGLPSTF